MTLQAIVIYLAGISLVGWIARAYIRQYQAFVAYRWMIAIERERRRQARLRKEERQKQVRKTMLDTFEATQRRRKDEIEAQQKLQAALGSREEETTSA